MVKKWASYNQKNKFLVTVTLVHSYHPHPHPLMLSLTLIPIPLPNFHLMATYPDSLVMHHFVFTVHPSSTIKLHFIQSNLDYLQVL
jgi:hypothetical protein